MSGNSSRRRRTTSPILSRRSRCGFCVATVFNAARSSLHERQPVLPDLDLVAVLQPRAVDPAAVDEGAVQRPLVLDEESSVALDQEGVVARDGDVVEEDVA